MKAREMRNLAFLRRLVSVLTATMILGVLAITTLLFLRLNQAQPAAMPLPEALTLPGGTRALAVTYTRERILVITEEDELLIFDAQGEELRQRITLAPVAFE